MQAIEIYNNVSLSPTAVQNLASVAKLKFGKDIEDGLAILQLNVSFLEEVISFFAEETKWDASKGTYVKKYPDLKINERSVQKIIRESIVRGNYLERESGDFYYQLRKNSDGSHNLEATPKTPTLIQEAYLSGAIIDHKQPEILYNQEGEVEKVIIHYQSRSKVWESRCFEKRDFDRWKQFSAKQNTPRTPEKNKDYANALYSSGKNGTIDPFFAATKAEKHTYKRFVRNPMQALAQSKFIAPDLDKSANEYDMAASIEEIPHEVVDEETPNKKSYYVQTHETVTLTDDLP